MRKYNLVQYHTIIKYNILRNKMHPVRRKNFAFPVFDQICGNLLQFPRNRVNTTQTLFRGSCEMENRVCENQETTIMRAFEFRKEGLEYLQKLPLEEKITLSKNLIVSCMETFGEQVDISFSGGKDSTVLSSLVCSLKPDILHLFSDTGCEYPETLSFVEEERQRVKNIVPVRPVCRDGSV